MFYVLSYFDADDGDTPAGVYDDLEKAKEAAAKDEPGLTWSVPFETNMFWGKLPDNPNYGYYITEFELNASVGITTEEDDDSDGDEPKLGVDAPDFDNTRVPNFEPWKDLMNDHVFTRGDIPEEYWDVTLTPTIIQVGRIVDLIRDKYFDDNQIHPSINSDFTWAMRALDNLGDSRWLSTEDFIHSLEQFPNMEDFT